jgi:hypothetical protein
MWRKRKCQLFVWPYVLHQRNLMQELEEDLKEMWQYQNLYYVLGLLKIRHYTIQADLYV